MRDDSENLQVHAYLDGEMDLQSQLRFEERLERDGELRARVHALQSLSQSVRGEAAYHEAPAELRARVAAMAGAQSGAAPALVRQPRAAWGAQLAGWLDWRPLIPALALASVATLAVNMILVRAGDDERLQRELVASHVRATMGQRSIDVASSDQHTVKPWFATHLDYSPPVRPLDLPGAVILGGRVDYVNGRRVAVIVYQYGKHLVDHYVWPSGQTDSDVKVAIVDGIRIAQWTRGGMAHKLVSDLNGQELQVIVQACQRQEEKG